MARRFFVLVVSFGVGGALAAGAIAAQAKTLRFTALFLPRGRVARDLRQPEADRHAGTGTVYTLAAMDGRSTRYRFRSVLKTGTIGLVGTITATANGGTSQKFGVTPGSGAYKTAHGTATLATRPGGAAGIVVTIQLK